MTLTARQATFVSQYAVHGNGTRAAIAAGYGEQGAAVAASRMLRKSKVLEALRAEQRVTAAKLHVTRESVLVALQEAVELAKLRQDPMAMVSAYREIAKICGYYEPERRVVTLTDAARMKQHEFEALSDEELLAMAAEDT